MYLCECLRLSTIVCTYLYKCEYYLLSNYEYALGTGYVGIVILVSAISSPTIFGEDLRSDFLTRSNQDITRLLFRVS